MSAERTTPVCQFCGNPLVERGRGRPARFCGDRCRKAASRAAAAATPALPPTFDPVAEAAQRREQMVMDGLMGVRQVAVHMSVGKDVVYGLLNSGQLPQVRIGGRRLIPRRELVRFMADRLEGAGLEPV